MVPTQQRPTACHRWAREGPLWVPNVPVSPLAKEQEQTPAIDAQKKIAASRTEPTVAGALNDGQTGRQDIVSKAQSKTVDRSFVGTCFYSAMCSARFRTMERK